MQQMTAEPAWTGTHDPSGPPPLPLADLDDRTNPGRMMVTALALAAVSWALIVWLVIAACSI